jgi:hypothetical protein
MLLVEMGSKRRSVRDIRRDVRGLNKEHRVFNGKRYRFDSVAYEKRTAEIYKNKIKKGPYLIRIVKRKRIVDGKRKFAYVIYIRNK